MIALVLAAFAVRLLLCVSTIDVPGDGPERAASAFYWARHRYLPTYGGWPPGFMFLSGLVGLLVPHVLWAPRLLNAALGGGSVVALYAVAREPFGRPVAIASALLLAWFPLHLFLSASALTEPSALFEMLAAMALVFAAPRRGMALLVPAAVLLVLAAMTRYEVWPLLPWFPLYVAVRTGRHRVALAFAVTLAAFPIAWSLGNLVHQGDAFVGINAALHERSFGETKVDLWRAIGILGYRTGTHLGWILATAMVFGIGTEIVNLLRRRLSAERACYLLVTLSLWGAIGAFAVARGSTLWNRYLVILFVLSLPLAVSPFFTGSLGRRTARAPWTTGLALSLSALLSYALVWPFHDGGYWITRERPHEIVAAARWIEERRLGETPVVLTPMGWTSTYLATYLPSVAGRTLIVSEWHDDAYVNGWIKHEHPSLLLTGSGDERQRSRIEDALGRSVDERALLHSIGSLRIYDLRTSGRARASRDRTMP
jgi:hypothetical protein